jgi:putative cardiolipin synthase
MYSAQVAARSLDIQTYIWHADMTGKMLAQRALAAADRGVQVRILIDDLDARAKNAGFAALDAHPNIEVRLFNPFASRSGTLRRMGEFGTGFRRLNHRMHNKSWIVDNRVALVGGRNLGNEYFGADENGNFVDLDVLMVGPGGARGQHHLRSILERDQQLPHRPGECRSGHARGTGPAARAAGCGAGRTGRQPLRRVLREDPAVQRLLADEGSLHWSERWSFASDDPLKLENSRRPGAALIGTGDIVARDAGGKAGAQRDLAVLRAGPRRHRLPGRQGRRRYRRDAS